MAIVVVDTEDRVRDLPPRWDEPVREAAVTLGECEGVG
ncbi:hypothetical protein ACF061_11995 [Streptomyces sp. NPDC015220]